MSEYSVRINRRDGAVEVSGDKDWVDEKLRQLAPVYEAPVTDEGANRTTQPRKRTKRSKPKDGGPVETKEKQPRRRRSGRPQRSADLAAKLTSQVKQELQEHRDARSTAFDKKATNQAAIIAGFLRDELEMNEVGEDDLYTIYNIMGWSTPTVRSALMNAAERDKYFGGMTDGKRELTQKGENFARHGSVNAE
jgi:hypothetical protein